VKGGELVEELIFRVRYLQSFFLGGRVLAPSPRGGCGLAWHGQILLSAAVLSKMRDVRKGVLDATPLSCTLFLRRSILG